MAMAQVPHQASDTDCSVCHEPFKNPKILPCGHVVCRHCLVSWLRAQPQAGCPLCRCAVLEREDQPGSLEEEVGALPTDLVLAELVEARALLDKDHTCCVCDYVAATALCLHCQDMLCASCAKAHGKLSTTKHHKVQDLSTLTPDALVDSRPSPCSSHPDSECTLYCPTHGLCVCVLCAAARPRCCPDLRDLEMRTEEACAALEKMAASLSASETELKDAIQRLDRHIRDTEERVQTSVTDIQKACDRLEAGVKNCRDCMVDLARRAASDIQGKTRAAIAILQGRKSKVTLHTAVVQRAKGSKAPVTISDMHSLMQTRVPTLDCSVTLPASAEVRSTLTFVIDEQAVRGVEQALGQLGRVQLVPADHLAVYNQTRKFAFHTNHGSSIVLGNSNLTATYNGEGAGHGIVLSRDPMVADVVYEVRLDKWKTAGVMMVGVLPERPDRVTLPKWSEQLRPASLVCPGSVKLSGADHWRSIHPITSAMKGLRQGQRVGVSLDASRQVHLHVDGKERGVWDTAVVGPCHAIIDLRGSKQILITSLDQKLQTLTKAVKGRRQQFQINKPDENGPNQKRTPSSDTSAASSAEDHNLAKLRSRSVLQMSQRLHAGLGFT